MDYNWKDLNDMPDELNVLFIEGFCQVPWFQNKFWTMPNDNGKKTFQFNEIFVYGAQIQCISTVKASHPMHSESTNVTPKSRVESIAPLLWWTIRAMKKGIKLKDVLATTFRDLGQRAG